MSSLIYRYVEFDREIVKYEDLTIVAPSLISASYQVSDTIHTATYIRPPFEQRPLQHTGTILVLLRSPRKIQIGYSHSIQAESIADKYA
jgi:hypothetical protein